MEKIVKSMPFDGDIVITDPCYILRKRSHQKDCEFSGYGEDMEALVFENYITDFTLCGDWNCEVFSRDFKDIWTPIAPERKVSEFCADAAKVGVFLLSEIHRYNSKFNWFKTKTWTTTLIKDFHGTVKFIELTDPDDEESLHFVGVGNKPFFPRQVWWTETFSQK